MVGPAGERGEHFPRLLLGFGLSKTKAVQKDHCIRRDNQGVLRQGTDGLCLFAADGGYDLLGGEGGVISLVGVRHDDFKIRNPNLPQQLLAAGGLGG